jgi:hypothetical protein
VVKLESGSLGDDLLLIQLNGNCKASVSNASGVKRFEEVIKAGKVWCVFPRLLLFNCLAKPMFS